MRDVVALADRVAILGNGRKYVDRPLAGLSADDLSHLIMNGSANPAVAPIEPRQMTWRLVIPRIGVDAVIQPLGRDSHGAVASPSKLDAVGWFDQSSSPGLAGDAILDGHLGLPGQPAVPAAK